MLAINNLRVSVEQKEILKGVSIKIKSGETHVVMGPNGSGKSTLAKALMGHPDYIVKGSCKLNDKDLLSMKVHERFHAGLFLAFQNPVAINGVSVRKMLRSVRSKGKSVQGVVEMNKEIDRIASKLSISPDLLKRSLNEGFSGGEKKKIETLQTLFLKPKIAIIDEVDTGLDVDALRVVAQGINELAKSGTGILLITHYHRILKYVRPDHVHVMIEGEIVKSGESNLAKSIEEKGYKAIQTV